MARPAKPVGVNAKHLTKKEKEARQKLEAKTRGDNSKLIPPDDMPEDQKKYFYFFITELAQAETLGNIDVPILSGACRCFARLDAVERRMDNDPDWMFDKELTMSQDRLVKQSMRYINELGLSPQSRAKLGTIAVSKAEKAPTIMDLLADDE